MEHMYIKKETSDLTVQRYAFEMLKGSKNVTKLPGKAPHKVQLSEFCRTRVMDFSSGACV